MPAAVPYLTLDLCMGDLVVFGTAHRPVIGLGCSKRYDSRQHSTKPAGLWRTGRRRAGSTWHVSFGWRRKPTAALPPDMYPVRWARFATAFKAVTECLVNLTSALVDSTVCCRRWMPDKYYTAIAYTRPLAIGLSQQNQSECCNRQTRKCLV